VQDLDDMRRLLDDSLLAIETGKPDHHEELIAIADVLEREVSDLSPEARTAELLGDPVSLRRLFANLTDNAIAYGGEATIVAATHGERIVVTIDDRGGGIDKTLREAVFEPFVRLEESRNRNTGGAGLGTRAIVELPLFPMSAHDETRTSQGQ
jgi:signal transduction histidine kinase